MEEYKTYKLEDITKGKGCYGIAASAVPYSPSLLTYLRITDINDDGTLNRTGLMSVDDANATNYLLEPNDIVFARTGNSTGRTYFYDGSDGELVYAGFLIKFSLDDKKVNPRILKYYTHSKPYYDWVHSFDTGGTRGNINAKTFGNLPLVLPSRKAQDRIVEIMKSFDDKIEVNRQINDNLEQQAQALFKSWFVDFEPYKGSGFEETEIGRIPKDLLVKRVSEIPHTIETGRRPKGGVGEITSGVPSVGAEHVKGLGNYDYSKTKYITEEYASSLKTGKVNGYELLIYKDGGKPGYFIPNYSIFGEGYPFEECFLNEHVFKLDFGDKGYNAFCYFYFWTDYVMNYLNAQGGKAAIPGINRQDIENIQIYAPENELVKRFGDIVLPSIRQILFNCKESRRLAQLRDTLLPRLMSGELKVNEIEMH
ncbi:MAG: restriction endonuclease subunit S [Bacteroidales bacterium]|nr:restriction endonuclease subunit S [Bacteroidales bacterium]